MEYDYKALHALHETVLRFSKKELDAMRAIGSRQQEVDVEAAISEEGTSGTNPGNLTPQA